MERENMHCTYDLNQNGSINAINGNAGGSNHIYGHLEQGNHIHEQMLLLTLPHQNDGLAADHVFPSGPRIMETIIVMSDPLVCDECRISPSPQIIVVQDSEASEKENDDSDPLHLLQVEESLIEINSDHSMKDDVPQAKQIELDDNICVKIDLNNTSVKLHPSFDSKVEPVTEEIEVPPVEETNNIRKSLRPRRQVVEIKPIINRKIQPETDEEEEQLPPPRLKPKSRAQNITIESDDEFEEDDSFSEDEEMQENKKCVVCLRHREFVECIFDDNKELHHHICAMLAYVDLKVKRFSHNIGICIDCFDQLQHWHIFISAIQKRHETALSNNEKFIDEPIAYETFQARVYRNFKKMGRVKEVYLSATHSHYARRHLTEKDWDYFCDHLFHSNSVKSEKSKELERFLTSNEKLSHLYCLKCKKLISNGKNSYKEHMESDHGENPVMYPCDICGISFPEKDMTASTEDYYPHWISHFYFNSCEDCGKRFPTKRALGQHRHAVHKNRQVKCERCGKVLANKMSLDLHLLRHLPENEKKKYLTKCKICKKRIAQWNIKSHMATHNAERPWKCDHCEATFKMKGALVSHRDVVHFNLKNHVCSTCGEAFKSASSLRGHVRRHEGRKDYKCEVCLKEYYTYSALKGHKIVHQTTRDFICDVCNKAFKKKKALEEHVTIHTGLKQHQCPICGREIRVKSNLYKHMKIHNKKNSNDPVVPKPTKKKNITKNLTEIIQPNNSIIEKTLEGLEQSPTTVTLSTLLTEVLPSTSTTTMNDTIHAREVNTNHNEVQFAVQPVTESINFISPHFHTNQGSVAHTISMQHQHQDLLNVPLIPGHFYSSNGQQYFTALDQLQN